MVVTDPVFTPPPPPPHVETYAERVERERREYDERMRKVVHAARPPVATLDMKGRDKQPKKDPIHVTAKNIAWCDQKAHPEQVLRAYKWVTGTGHANTKTWAPTDPWRWYFIKRTRIGSLILNERYHNEAAHTYQIGGVYFVTDADTDRTKDCGRGLNVGTFEWCSLIAGSSAGAVHPSYLLLEVEFKRKDVAAFPVRIMDRYRPNGKRLGVGYSQYSGYWCGKFRLHSFKVVSGRCISSFEADRANGADQAGLKKQRLQAQQSCPTPWFGSKNMTAVKARNKARKLVGLEAY